MASTYTPIATTTLGSDTSSYTFSSIPSTYTDLILIISGIAAIANKDYRIQFNGDTATNYSVTTILGSGTAASSSRRTNANEIVLNNNGVSSGAYNQIIHINNYANTTTYKTTLGRSNSAGGSAESTVGLWRSTSAINSIKYMVGDLTNALGTGSTFTLYGVTAA